MGTDTGPEADIAHVDVDMSNWSLDDVDRAYQEARITRAQAVEYIRLWNCSSPRFTQAIIRFGRIENWDKGVFTLTDSWLKEYVEEFGVIL